MTHPTSAHAQPATLLYWAVIGHYRYWLAFDGIERHRLECQGNRLDAPAVRRIGIEYKVNRGVYQKADAQPARKATGKSAARRAKDAREDGAPRLAVLINEGADAGWDTWDLRQRAERCAEIAKAAADNGATRGRLASAVSKLMWFIRPRGWTLYDDLSANATVVAGRNTVEEMLAFYCALQERGFAECAAEINRRFASSALRELYGERVIDKFFLLHGQSADERADSLAVLEVFLSILLPCVAQALDVTARDIDAACASEARRLLRP